MNTRWKANLVCLVALALVPFSTRAEYCMQGAVEIKSSVICRKYDPVVTNGIVNRNLLMIEVNAFHRAAVGFAKKVQEAKECEHSNPTTRDQQIECLGRMYAVRSTVNLNLREMEQIMAGLGRNSSPEELKDQLRKSITSLVQSMKKVAELYEPKIAQVEKFLRDTLLRRTNLVGKAMRNEARNKVFCQFAPDRASQGSKVYSRLLAAIRMNDVHGFRESRSRISELVARAEASYKLCELTDYTALDRLRELQKMGDNKAAGFDERSVFDRACADSEVKKWPRLAIQCGNFPPTEETLYSIHRALFKKYSEED